MVEDAEASISFAVFLSCVTSVSTEISEIS